MPDEYIKGARQSMSRGEELVLQVSLYTNNDQRTGYADKLGTMNALQKFEKG